MDYVFFSFFIFRLDYRLHAPRFFTSLPLKKPIWFFDARQ